MSFSKKEKDRIKKLHVLYQYNRLHTLPQLLCPNECSENENTTIELKVDDIPSHHTPDNLQYQALPLVLSELYLKKFYNSCKKNQIVLEDKIRGHFRKSSFNTRKQCKLINKTNRHCDVKLYTDDNKSAASTTVIKPIEFTKIHHYKFCNSCGNLRIPIINTEYKLFKRKFTNVTVDINAEVCNSTAINITKKPNAINNSEKIMVNKKMVNKKNKYCLQLHCLICDDTSYIDYIDIPPTTPLLNVSTTTTTTTTNRPLLNAEVTKGNETFIKKKNALSKQRAKKRKANTLENILKEKKRKEEESKKKKSMSLSLSDFLTK
ncbi:uncharacterized protein SCODWIG_00760 [Saccharomycodes ludwigii]|uniref:Uncharacterized protein n=1 Tax=Saccharomycodes ludwigii TaxID=36035 RepID=A0A376B321_9ASCO|nr:hypothetical protein SCDLUD_004871 [Saccharomycodes ludwigii]KAH3899428.1 hypothetical protein SCDLUD_004871 [Saccharomycodes ludwigii]SSD58999.1 uncharacterized protein SCODWIG_00760 [Saccharomycodes ludwigii]